MPSRCESDSERPWKSKLNNQYEDGTFLISVDASGVITGEHQPGGETIKGRCMQNGMWFFMPAADPLYFYTGVFTPDDYHVKGKRTVLAKADGVAANGVGLPNLVAGDDWTNEKPT